MTAGRSPAVLVSAALATALAAGGSGRDQPGRLPWTSAVATTYVCDLGDPYGCLRGAVHIDVHDVPSKLPVGVPVDDAWDVENDLTLDELLVAVLYRPRRSASLRVADDLGLVFGDSAVPVDLASARKCCRSATRSSCR